jgi:tRNA pseudouridine38-40 synthase
MRTLKITIQYDGTDFVGWQRQASGSSVQSLIEAALARIEGRDVPVVGAGRTDAGVHALGQVASFALQHAIAPDTLARALNATLPPAIRITAASEAPYGFNARFDARAKTYRYRILNRQVASPFDVRYAWHLPQRLDTAAMRTAASALVGTHDFEAFRSTGSDVRSTVRTMFEADVRRLPAEGPGLARTLRDAAPAAEDLIVFTIRGDGFLRHMVRSVVGTLVTIGAGQAGPDLIGMLLQSGPRQEAGPTAPAHGLFLVSVEYGTAA